MLIMKKYLFVFISIVAMMTVFSSCKSVKEDLVYDNPDFSIIFLHHSTGNNVWFGDVNQNARIRLKDEMAMVPRLLKEYNDEMGTRISIVERDFPSGDPYPWKNYPYDYYNIWVKHAGNQPYMEEPTLEMLTEDYDMIIFKFCYPYSNVEEDDAVSDINSEKKTIANYKLQYHALKAKMLEFPGTKFLVWTGAPLVETKTSEENAKRARAISDWVKEEWDSKGDNIYVFDFREIATNGGLYLLPEYAVGEYDSHPNKKLSTLAAEKLVDRIVSIINE
jgi:hypothetical protein